MQATATRTRRRPARPKTAPRGGRTNAAISRRRPDDIVVVGDVPSTASVHKVLKRLELNVVRVETNGEAEQVIGAQTRAVVCTAPMKSGDVNELLETCAGRASDGAHLPVFVVVPDECSDKRARGLYTAGAAAVFHWPRDAFLLPTMLVELLGVAPLAGRNKADRALQRAVDKRLELGELKIGKSVEVSVHAGVAAVSGKIGALWQKRQLLDTLSDVPGISGVLGEGLEVNAPKRGNAELSRDLRSAIRATIDDASTISVRAANGRVVIAGVLPTHAELDRLDNIATGVRGVEALENLVTVSPRAAKAASVRATKLERDLEVVFPGQQIKASAFGPVVVLRGEVPRLSVKRRLGAFALREDGVERVVNHVTVRSR